METQLDIMYYYISVCKIFLFVMPLIHSWQMPSPQFLIDFVNFHHCKSITIYFPTNVDSKPSLAEWQKDFSNRSKKFLQVSYISQDLFKNITNIKIMNEDLHVFIHQDLNPLGANNDNLQEFVRIYSLSKKWTHEYWLFDLSVTHNIEETSYLSQNLPLDLDDNLYLFASDGNDNGNNIDIWEFYEIHPTRPKKLDYYGSWTSRNGLNITNEEKWDRRNDLEGIQFATLMLDAYPYITVLEPKSDNPEDWNWRFEGWFGEVWFELQNLLNFTYKLRPPPDRQWGAKRSNGSWTGIIGELDEKRADISPGPLGMTYARSEVVSYSVPLDQQYFQFYIKNPEGATNFQAYSEPLHYVTWIFIVIFCFILPPFLLATVYYGLKDKQHEEFSFGNIIAFMFRSITNAQGGGWTVSPNNNAPRLVFFTIMAFGLLLNISWNANLISYLVTHNIEYPFDGLETLLSATDFKIALLPGSAHQDNFALSARPMHAKAWKERIEPFLDEYKPYQVNSKKAPPPPVIIAKYYTFKEQEIHLISAQKQMTWIPIENPSIVLYYPYQRIMGTKEYINCKIIAIPSKLDHRYVGWTFQKHSPYLPLFNHYLKMMMEKGIFKNLDNRFQPPPQICPDGAGRPIGFRNSITAFLVLSIGLILALFCFILETVYNFIKTSNGKMNCI